MSGIPLGGVKSHTAVPCSRPGCGMHIMIPPGMVLRVPAEKPRGHCHEVVNPHTGTVVRRG